MNGTAVKRNDNRYIKLSYSKVLAVFAAVRPLYAPSRYVTIYDENRSACTQLVSTYIINSLTPHQYPRYRFDFYKKYEDQDYLWRSQQKKHKRQTKYCNNDKMPSIGEPRVRKCNGSIWNSNKANGWQLNASSQYVFVTWFPAVHRSDHMQAGIGAIW